MNEHAVDYPNKCRKKKKKKKKKKHKKKQFLNLDGRMTNWKFTEV